MVVLWWSQDRRRVRVYGQRDGRLPPRSLRTWATGRPRAVALPPYSRGVIGERASGRRACRSGWFRPLVFGERSSSEGGPLMVRLAEAWLVIFNAPQAATPRHRRRPDTTRDKTDVQSSLDSRRSVFKEFWKFGNWDLAVSGHPRLDTRTSLAPSAIFVAPPKRVPAPTSWRTRLTKRRGRATLPCPRRWPRCRRT